MQKYRKLMVAILAFFATVFIERGMIEPESGELFVRYIVEVLALFGILLIPNKDYDGKW